MKASEKIGLLLYKYMRNELTRKEMSELMDWRNRSLKHDTAFREAIEWDNVFTDLQWSARNSDAILEKVKERVPGLWQKEEEKPKAKIRFMTRFLRAAAVTIFMLIFIGYRYSVYENAHPHPGTYAGMINGSSDDFAIPAIHDLIRGFKAGEANVKVVEHENGDMEYIATSNPKAGLDKSFELRSYRGNAFMLTLKGIGRIWINASTNIWYPANFSGDTLRIKLSGEAWFDIAANKPVKIEIPSPIIHNPSTIISESGTFNVQAYPSDSLKVARDEQSVAWKNKMIYYQDASLKTILEEISRWYDVDVEFKGSIPDKKYTIRLPRNAAFSEVIRILREQGAKLFVNGKNIYVL
jgi:transmembrane sensor